MSTLRGDVALSAAGQEPTAAPAADERGPAPEARWLRPPVVFGAALVAVALPIAVAAVRAVARDWLPIGDNALFAIRARDVFGFHPPLLGTWSSASLSAGADINQPGPLMFVLLAPTRLLFGPGPGIAAGVALVNVAAVVGIGVVGYRRGGVVLGVLATAVAGALCWSMGSELLFDPWNPHSLLLPFLCFLMLVWSVTRADLAALPWAAGVGSLVLQTHLSYGVLVPVLAAWAVVGLVLELRRRRRRSPRAWPRIRRRVTRVAWVTLLVLVVCWAPPVVEQLANGGDGNLVRLARSLRHQSEPIGFEAGTRALAGVVALPPWWLPPSFEDTFLPDGSVPSAGFIPQGRADVPSLAEALASLAVVDVVLVACGAVARRRRDREAWAAVATGAVVLAVGVFTAARAPRGVFGLAPHQFRWLWPLAAFLTFAVAATVIGARRIRAGRASVVGAVLVGVVVLVAALTMPFNSPYAGPSADAFAIPAIRGLRPQLGALEDAGTLLVEAPGGFDPYTPAVMSELQRADIPFVVRDHVAVRQLGSNRRFTGDNADAVLLVRWGDAVRITPPGTRRAALRAGIGRAGREERVRLEDQLGREIDGGRPFRLTQSALDLVARGQFPTVARLVSGADASTAQLFASRELVVMTRAGLLSFGDDVWNTRLRRYAELQHRWHDQTVALFVGPITDEVRAAARRAARGRGLRRDLVAGDRAPELRRAGPRPVFAVAAIGIALVGWSLLLAVVVLRDKPWVPTLDQAMTELRVRDVDTRHAPLVGLPGRIGPLDQQGSHPGPMSFWAMWPVYKVLGSTAHGLQIAAVVLHLAAAATALWLAYRRGGIVLAGAIGGLLAVLVRAYGVGTLTDPWNLYLPLLWWVVFVLAAWSVASGDRPALPVAVAAGTFCMQTHISYVALVAGIGVLALVLLVAGERRGGGRGALRPWSIAAAVTVVVLWAPPVVDELRHSPGNLSIAWDYFRDPPEAAIGLRRGAALMVRQLDPWRLVTDDLTQPGSLVAASDANRGSLVPGLLLLAAWAWAAGFAWRWRHQALLRLHAVLAGALVLGMLSLSRIFGPTWYYLGLWAWGITAFVVVAVGWTVVEGAGRREGSLRRGVLGAVAGASAVLLGFTLVATVSQVDDLEVPGPRLSANLRPLVAPTAAALRRLDRAAGTKERYVVTWRDALSIGSQGFGLLDELERRGLHVGVTPAYRVPATPHRGLDPNEPRAEVHLATGVHVRAAAARPGFREVASVDPRTPAEHREYRRLRARVLSELRAAGLGRFAPLVDENVFGVALDRRLPRRVREALSRMVDLGLPTAVFIGPPPSGG